MSKWICFAVLVTYLSLIPVSVLAESAGETNFLAHQDYLNQLIQESMKKGLSADPYWHLLLHHRKNIWGGYRSEADGPGFFLSSIGRADPQTELEATLTKFFSDEMVGTSAQQAQCAFPARYHWLKEQLSFDPNLLPENDCERFKTWMTALDPESVTLIFPSAYMNNPSSMFGHTLLRIDQKGQTSQTRLLAYAINYAAKVDIENGFLYAVQGIGGGFKGFFSIMPYYLKVQEYSEMENRDIWEYRLNFNREQIERMLMHAWELGNTYFDYYFFKENCSYHLLSLLEIADPKLHLIDHFWGWTIPADTVRLVAEQPGLVMEREYRPARITQIQSKRDLLSRDEQRILYKLVKKISIDGAADLQALPVDRQALILDVASNYLRYKVVEDSKNRTAYENNLRTLLISRSSLRIPSSEVKFDSPTGPPELGHEIFRAGVGFGWLEGEPFEQITIRPVYHDLLDDETGYTREAQIEALSLKLRYYNQTNRIRLKNLTLIDILSLSPMDSLLKKISWKINAGFETVREGDCSQCNSFDLNLGVGGAIQTHLLHREILYGFLEPHVNYGNAYEKSYRVGGGSTVGVLANITQRWKIYLFSSYWAFPLGDHADDFRVSLHQRYTLHQNLSFRLELNRRDHQDEVMLALQAYF